MSLKSEIDVMDHSYLDDHFMQKHMIDMDDDPDLITGDNTDDSNHSGDKNLEPLREQDRFLPIANVAKIMKRSIPETGKIAKDARECIQECVSEFISFVTSEASDRCTLEKRKTINGDDILYALNALGFDNYVEPLRIYLEKYRDAAKSDRNLNNGEIFKDEDYDENIGATSTTHQSQSMPSVSDTTVMYSPAQEQSYVLNFN